MRTLLWSLALLAVWACEADPREPTLDIELGTGIDTFEAVEDGQTLRIAEGLQGGFHVFGAVRAAEVEPHDARFDFALYQGDTQIGGASYRDDLIKQGDDWVFPGVTVFLWDDFAPEEAAGKLTRMTATLVDGRARVGRAELEFVPACCDYLP